MAVSIQTMLGSENVGLSRLTINTNFAALKAASDAVTALLDPTTLSLSGIKSVQIDNSALSLSSAILSVSKGASILGDLVLGTTTASTSVAIRGNGGVNISEGSLTIGVGNLSLSSTSLLTSGNVSIVGEKRAPGLVAAFAATIGLTNDAATTSIPVSTLKYIIISNGGTGASALAGLQASLVSGSSGQELELFHTLGASAGPVKIATSNFAGLTGSIILTATGDKIKCIYEGTSWYLWDFTMGSTASISITRI
jgi:hypothetical protein